MFDKKEYNKKWYLNNKLLTISRSKKWREDNPELNKVYMHDYFQNNKAQSKEQRKASWSKYYSLNRKHIKESNKGWYENNKAYAAQRQKSYRNTKKGRMVSKTAMARRRSLLKDLTTELVQLVYENNIKNYGTLTCYLCLNPIVFGKDHLEHNIPLCRGGTNEYENLGVSCEECNLRKNRKTAVEFITEKKGKV